MNLHFFGDGDEEMWESQVGLLFDENGDEDFRELTNFNIGRSISFSLNWLDEYVFSKKYSDGLGCGEYALFKMDK